jgi:DNA-binding response OmpR family regulator
LRRCHVKDHGDRDIVTAPGLALNLTTGQLTVDGRSVHLTEIETDLLRYFMLRVATPIAAQQLMSDVLDFPPETGDSSTIRAHIHGLRQKIELHPEAPVHLCTVKPRGYCFHTS